MASRSRLLRAGETCWVTPVARSFACLVDAAAYYGTLRTALLAAERSVYILGWDVDSRTPLVGEGEPRDSFPRTLLPFLLELLERRPQLQVHILAWDYAILYALEREALPFLRFGSKHPRLHFRLDDTHPAGAAHHQKVVVIDDDVAFSGGLDLTIRRWDTPVHAAADPGRVDPAGKAYEPMHDVQSLVTGPAATALGDLFRQRWKAATGEALHAAPVSHDDGALPCDAHEVTVGISRTYATAAASTADIREVERLTLEAIGAARRLIYIENQYLTSAAACRALAARLEERDGPEVVLVLPMVESGLIEKESMGVLRARVLRTLRLADAHHRLAVLRPEVVADDRTAIPIYVHAKVMIIDDWLLRIGSANISNRSLALDSECDVSIEASKPGDAIARVITGVRNRLIAEHTGLSPADVAAAVDARGSLVAALRQLPHGPRRLVALEREQEPAIDLAVLDGLMCDPERAIEAERVFEALVPPDVRPSVRRRLLWMAVFVLVIAGAGVLARQAHLLAGLRDGFSAGTSGIPATVALTAAVALTTTAFVPITVVIAAAAILVPPVEAFTALYAGSLTAAGLNWVAGRKLGPPPLGRWLSRKTLRLRKHVRRGGFMTVLTARLLPVGNFALINLLAGAFGVPFRSYMVGNAVGLLPGLLGVSVIAGAVRALAASRTLPSVFGLVLAVALVAAILFVIRSALRRKEVT